MPRSNGHVSNNALSLAWLLRFTAEHQIRERRLTTAQVVYELVVPETAAAKCRYTDLLMRDPRPEQRSSVSAGRPFFFISHAWGRPFAETLDMNQHPDSGQQGDDPAALKEVVGDAEETLMVLDPEGSPLTRIWCLYEAWQAGRAAEAAATCAAGADDGVADAGAKGAGGPAPGGSGGGGHKLRLLSYGIPFDEMKQVFIDLDVAAARATKEDDRTRILADIAAEPGGLPAMTHRLKDALVAGAAAQAPAPEEAWSREARGRLTTAAHLCELYDRLEAAEQLLRRDLQGAEAALGADHPELLISVANLAQALYARGALTEAEPLFRRYLAGCEAHVGCDHPRTLHALQTVAWMAQAGGRSEEAEGLYRRALAGSEAALGERDSLTLFLRHDLAGLLSSQGRMAEAEPLYRRALADMEAVLGPDDPDTIAVVQNLAVLLINSAGGAEGDGGDGGGGGGGRRGEAEALCRRALAAGERVFGPQSEQALKSLSALGKLLLCSGRYEDAEPLYRRALAGLEATLGPDNLTTLAVGSNLADALAAMARLEEAESVLRRVVEGISRAIGRENPLSLATARKHVVLLLRARRCGEAAALHAGLLEALLTPRCLDAAALDWHADCMGCLLHEGLGQQAEALARRATEAAKRGLGAGHPATRVLTGMLCRVLEVLGRREEADAEAEAAAAAAAASFLWMNESARYAFGLDDEGPPPGPGALPPGPDGLPAPAEPAPTKSSSVHQRGIIGDDDGPSVPGGPPASAKSPPVHQHSAGGGRAQAAPPKGQGAPRRQPLQQGSPAVPRGAVRRQSHGGPAAPSLAAGSVLKQHAQQGAAESSSPGKTPPSDGTSPVAPLGRPAPGAAVPAAAAVAAPGSGLAARQRPALVGWAHGGLPPGSRAGASRKCVPVCGDARDAKEGRNCCLPAVAGKGRCGVPAAPPVKGKQAKSRVTM